MVSSFYTAISGSKSYQAAMDTIADNIANVNTVGFRAKNVEFDSLLSQTLAQPANGRNAAGAGIGTVDQVGMGVRVSATAMVTTQGSIKTTDKNFDLAISGDGWFGVQGPNGNQPAYTRNGIFNPDQNGNLVTTQGFKVLGMTSGALINNGDGTGSVSSTTYPGNMLGQTASPIILPPALTCPGTAAVPAVTTTISPQTIVLADPEQALQTNFAVTDTTVPTTIDFGPVHSTVGQMNIYDTSGALVQKIDLTTEQLNSGKYQWDGTTNTGTQAPLGNYTSKILYPGSTNQDIKFTLP
ncbi:MAG: flagellar hook protein, partial [Pseudomonadota bacterium]